MHIFTWESATAKKKVKKVQLSTDALIWEPATAKNHRRCSLQVSHFHLGACHRKNVKNIQLAAVTFSLGSLPPQKKKVKKFQFATVTLIWAPATRKREQMCSLQVSHSHLGACHRLNVKNIQFAAVTFSPGGLPPPKKKVKKVSFQLSTTTVIWESATTKNEQMCSLQVYHLGACHQKNVKSRLQNRRWDRLEHFFHTKEDCYDFKKTLFYPTSTKVHLPDFRKLGIFCWFTSR